MQAEGMDILVSDVARMVGGEKALTEECGFLLSKIYSSQVDRLSPASSFSKVLDCEFYTLLFFVYR